MNDLKRDPELAYKTAVDLLKLASQEIYSRFAAMLTLHGFLFAAIGLSLTRQTQSVVPEVLGLALAVAGLVLCQPWRHFVEHGLDVQRFFRTQAIKAEGYYDDSMRIFTALASRYYPADEPSAKTPAETSAPVTIPSFRESARWVTWIVQVVYCVLLFAAMVQLYSKLSSQASGVCL